MDNETTPKIIESYFVALEERVDELVRRCEQLALENQALTAQHNQLLAERNELIDQNEQSRARIDAMVARLKGLEQST